MGKTPNREGNQIMGDLDLEKDPRVRNPYK